MKTIYDSINPTRTPKGVLLIGWSLQGISVTKEDRVHYEVQSEIWKFKLRTAITLDLMKWKLNIF